MISLLVALAVLAASQTPADSGRVATIKIFLVAVGDAGRSGQKIGCDDSLVAVERPVSSTDTPLKAAVADLLSLRDTHYGQSGLYNALAQSTLQAKAVNVANGRAEIRLTGTVTLSGTCDAPRVDAQIRETARQFPAVTRVDVFVDDVPLQKILAAK